MFDKKEIRKTLHEALAKNCYEARTLKGWNQAKLAEKVKVDESTIKRIEDIDKDYIPGADTLYILAHVFGIPMDALSGNDPSILCERDKVVKAIIDYKVKMNANLDELKETILGEL